MINRLSGEKMIVLGKDTARLPWLRGMSHNGRVVALTEPFWSIPYNMFTVYAVLYMMELGLTDREIGLIQTVLVATQILSSVVSGSLTDLLGRKRTTFLFDLISWGGACLVWAFSRSVSGFLLAAVLNGINRVVTVSFTCMVTEDATSEQRLRNYSGLHFMVLTGGFFTPLAGIVIKRLGIVEGTKLIYLGAALIMAAMFFVRNILWIEPLSGKGEDHRRTIRGIIDSLRYFLEDRQRSVVFILQSFAQFFLIFKPLFYYAYLRDSAGISPSLISLIPLIISLITMVILLGLLPRVKNSRRKGYLTAGFILGGISLFFLLLSDSGNLYYLSLSVLTDGVSTALIRPLLDSLWADKLDDRRRTRQLAAGNLFFGLISIPAGSSAAELYSLSPLLPFAASAALMLISAGLSLTLKKQE